MQRKRRGRGCVHTQLMADVSDVMVGIWRVPIEPTWRTMIHPRVATGACFQSPDVDGRVACAGKREGGVGQIGWWKVRSAAWYVHMSERGDSINFGNCDRVTACACRGGWLPNRAIICSLATSTPLRIVVRVIHNKSGSAFTHTLRARG